MFREIEETNAPSIAPETQLTSEIRVRATTEQRTSNAQAIAKPALHEPLPLPKDSSKEESRQNNREDRTEKTEQQRHRITVGLCDCNDRMIV